MFYVYHHQFKYNSQAKIFSAKLTHIFLNKISERELTLFGKNERIQYYWAYTANQIMCYTPIRSETKRVPAAEGTRIHLFIED